MVFIWSDFLVLIDWSEFFSFYLLEFGLKKLVDL